MPWFAIPQQALRKDTNANREHKYAIYEYIYIYMYIYYQKINESLELATSTP